MLKIKNKKYILKLTGIIIFIIIIFTQIDFKKIYPIILSLDPRLLLLASFVSLTPVIIKMFRWQYILKQLNINYPLVETCRIYLFSIILGLFTPLNAGDFIGRSAFLKEDGYKIKTSFLSTIVDRLADLIIILIISGLGVFFFLHLLDIKFFITILAIPLSLFLFFLRSKKCHKLFLKIFFLITPLKYHDYFKKNIDEMLSSINSFNLSNILIILAMTFLSQLANLIFLYLLLFIINVNQISLLPLFFINAIITLISVIPITIGGFGTREATLIAFFSTFGIANEQTIIFSLLTFFIPLPPLLLINSYLLVKKNKT